MFFQMDSENVVAQWLAHFPLVLEIPDLRRGKFWSPITLSIVSFAGMTLDTVSASSYGSGR